MNLDDEFPLGDGTADVAARIGCPWCGEEVELMLDPGGGARQHYIEDCEICCRPMNVAVSWDEHGAAHVDATTDEDG